MTKNLVLLVVYLAASSVIVAGIYVSENTGCVWGFVGVFLIVWATAITQKATNVSFWQVVMCLTLALIIMWTREPMMIWGLIVPVTIGWVVWAGE